MGFCGTHILDIFRQKKKNAQDINSHNEFENTVAKTSTFPRGQCVQTVIVEIRHWGPFSHSCLQHPRSLLVRFHASGTGIIYRSHSNHPYDLYLISSGRFKERPIIELVQEATSLCTVLHVHEPGHVYSEPDYCVSTIQSRYIAVIYNTIMQTEQQLHISRAQYKCQWRGMRVFLRRSYLRPRNVFRHACRGPSYMDVSSYNIQRPAGWGSVKSTMPTKLANKPENSVRLT